MKHAELKQYLCENFGEGVAVLEPEYFDKAIIRTSETGRLVYSYDKLVEVLAEAGQMPEEDAVEWVEYNTISSLPSLGELSPIILHEITL